MAGGEVTIMRKVAVVFTTLAFAVLLTAAGWLGWRMWHQRQSPSPELALQLNQARETRLLQGTPLIFTISLTGSKRRPAMRIGSRGDPWYSHVSLQFADRKQAFPWKVVLLSAPQSLSYHRDAAERVQFETIGGDEALVNAEQLYTMDLGIDPQQAAQIQPGQYMVSAVLKPPFWPPWRWTKRVVSKPVRFTVEKQGETTAAVAELERTRLVKSIDFYLQAKQFQEAYNLALQLEKNEPDKVYGYLLEGDALSGLQRYADALEAYNHALHLAALRNDYEPPEYLLIRKHQVEQRLEQQR